MNTALNLHKLMSSDDGYLRELKVPARDQQKLTYARETIRATIRSAFRDWRNYVTRVELLDAALAKTSFEPQIPVPKFRLQGSFAYYTANDCQFPSDQQIDMDDGIFLPLTFVMVGGAARPTIASRAYFNLVERALAPLCVHNGWILNPTNPAKGTCVRVEIDDRLHVDLPLYAIKDEAFEELVAAAADTRLRKAAEFRDSVELDEQIYRDLADAEIILAHREKGWIESDPRKLEKWFTRAVEIHGPIVRELSRAFKGLRDAKWLSSDLGSICIMAAVVDVLGSIAALDPKRFDLSLVAVARGLSQRLESSVANPAFPSDADKNLCTAWTQASRDAIRKMFSDAAEKLSSAIHDSFHKGLAISRAQEAFGARVPNDETLIALGSIAASVRQTPPDPQPQPLVPRTKSG